MCQIQLYGVSDVDCTSCPLRWIGNWLWPLSRRNFAKQHVPVLGGASPFQRTWCSSPRRGTMERPIVITGSGARSWRPTRRAGRRRGRPRAGADWRDTWPRSRWARCWLPGGAGATVLVPPSDHLIPDSAAFAQAVAQAEQAGRRTARSSPSASPTAPATGYGYIRPGVLTERGAQVVAAFVESPDAKRAAILIEEGCYWNAGIVRLPRRGRLEQIRASPRTPMRRRRLRSGGRGRSGRAPVGTSLAGAEDQLRLWGWKTDRAAVVLVEFTPVRYRRLARALDPVAEDDNG